MAIIVQAATKTCVTCEYWGGVRIAGSTGREVRYKIKMSDGDSGACDNRASLKKGRLVRGGDIGCNRWEKWRELK